MYNETENYSLEAVLTRIEEKIDSYQKDISQRLHKIEERFTTLDSIETLRQDELTSRSQTLAELEERIEKLEYDQIDQNNRFGTRYESINAKVIDEIENLQKKILETVKGSESQDILTVSTTDKTIDAGEDAQKY